MRIRAYKENVAFATALGARVRKRTLCSCLETDENWLGNRIGVVKVSSRSEGKVLGEINLYGMKD